MEPLKRNGWVNTETPDECAFCISVTIASKLMLPMSNIVPFEGDENFISVINGTCLQLRKFFPRSMVAWLLKLEPLVI
jgi:hypothetical protein